MKITLNEAARRLRAQGFTVHWRNNKTILAIYYGDNEFEPWRYIADERDVERLIRWKNNAMKLPTKG